MGSQKKCTQNKSKTNVNPLLHNFISRPLTPLKYHVHVFENIMENGAFAFFKANAPFFIKFSKVFKTVLNFFLIFSMLSKKENDVMI